MEDHHISAEMLKFPTEIWSAIFEQAIDESRVQIAAIRSVNRTWRNIADRTRHLWRRIVLDRRVRFINLEFARIHLLNSANTPLEVVVDLPNDVSIAETNPVAALLKRHVSRFCKLSILARYQSQVDHLVVSIGSGEPAPLLEKFIATICGGDVLISTGFFSGAFFPAPRLVDLTAPVHGYICRTDPHLATVRSLTLESSNLNLWNFDLLRFVEAIPHLQRLTYKNNPHIFYIDFDILHNFRILMPHLVSADVSVPGFGLDLFRVIDAPLLTDIRFDGGQDRDGEPWRSLPNARMRVINSLQRVAAYSPLVKRIELRCIRLFENSNLYQSLLSGQEFSNIEVLRLDSVDVKDEHLRNSSRLGLGLKRLELHNCWVTGLALIDFVRDRTSEFELVIEKCPRVTENDLATLATIVTIA